MGKEYFFLAELFLVSDSIDKEIEVELNVTSEWLVPEFQSSKSKITFFSNICCVGYLFYKILYGKNPFQDENERKEEKIPKIDENFKYKELIENCIKINYKERWSIDDIRDYIDKNIYEEKEKENSNKGPNNAIIYNKINENSKNLETNERVNNLNDEENKINIDEEKVNEKNIENNKEKDIEDNKKEIDNKAELNKKTDLEDLNIELNENLELNLNQEKNKSEPPRKESENGKNMKSGRRGGVR